MHRAAEVSCKADVEAAEAHLRGIKQEGRDLLANGGSEADLQALLEERAAANIQVKTTACMVLSA